MSADATAPDDAELVTCPSCGKASWVRLRQRSSDDFCQSVGCGFPLFWAQERPAPAEGDSDGTAYRRLPGAVGLVTVATRPCPHCSERNLLAAEICVCCHQPMDPAPPPPPPVPEPEPVALVVSPVVQPAPSSWWMLVVLVIVGALLVWAVAAAGTTWR